MYVKSDKIKFYPSAYRYYVDNGVSVVTDEEASRNTEYNITSHIAKVFHSTKGSFIISEDNDTNLEFFIGGYYVKVDNVATNLLSNFSSDTDIYANIKTTLVTPPPTQGNWDNLFEVVEFEHEYKPLDYKSGNNIEFKGISFEDSENANATFSLHLFTREDTSSPFTLVAPSKFILTLGDILGNDGKSALDELKTRILLVTLINGENATFSGTVGAVNVNVGNQLTVTNKIVLGASSITLNNGAFVFDNDITFASAKNVGTSTTPVNNLYATNINLGASLLPTSQNVNLGATNNKINSIYANDVNATNINISGNLIPTNIYVELGSTNSPLGKVTTVGLAATYVELENIGSLRNDGILYLGAKYLMPIESLFSDLGTSTYQFNNVYAQYFRGTLKGNADTATYIRKTNSSPSSTTRHYLAAFTSPGTTNSSAVQVLENLTYLPVTNTLATNISGNAATAQKVSIAAFGNCAATSSPQNYVTISGNDYPNNVPAVYTVTMVKQTGFAPTRYGVLDTFTVKHYGSSLYTTSVFAITDVEAGYIYIFRLKFSAITDSSNYTATLQYSEDGGNTFADTGNELILRVDRQACY